MAQKTLSGFFGEEEKIVIKDKNISDKSENKPKIEKHIRGPNNLETDYDEKNRIEQCAQRIKERFAVVIEIFTVRYGTRAPINEKIYGYYLVISFRNENDKSKIAEFIRKDCRIKVYE